MSIVNWNNLKFKATNAGIDAAQTLRFRYTERPDGKLRFIARSPYKSAIAHWLKREAIAMAANELRMLFPRYQRLAEKKLREKVQKQQKENARWIIEDAVVVEEELGQITLDDNKTVITATDAWGRKVPESLILSYVGDEVIEGSVLTHNGQGAETRFTYSSKTVFVFDTCPSVSIQSGKNIVTTPVQGRDYSRKELVSGGDLTFQVSGSIVSHLAASRLSKGSNEFVVEYPDNDVKKLIQIMQHPGIINVNHYLFRQFNVTRIIIKDFSLQQAKYKNIQPYEFTCVAVEPDEDVIVKQDTINALNRELSTSKLDGWYKYILNNKLAELAGNIATGVATDATSLALDKLTFNAPI